MNSVPEPDGAGFWYVQACGLGRVDESVDEKDVMG
jgi:hypothetical protein